MFSKYRYGSVTDVPNSVSATGWVGGTGGGVGKDCAAGATPCGTSTAAKPKAMTKPKATDRNMRRCFSGAPYHVLRPMRMTMAAKRTRSACENPCREVRGAAREDQTGRDAGRPGRSRKAARARQTHRARACRVTRGREFLR